MNKLIKEVEEGMLSYNLNKAMRPITEFIDELSTWYLRRSRDRLKGEDTADRVLALSTMRFVFINLSKVMAPFMPFIAEDLWQKVSGFNFLNKDRSVHLESWPSFKEAINSEESLEKMDEVRKIIELGFAERDKVGIKVRQILSRATVFSGGLKIKDNNSYLDLIKDELNVKDVEMKKEEEGDLRVEIDTNISEELKKEGVKRELIRFINLMRKDNNLSIEDLAEVEIKTNSHLVSKTLELFKEDIKKETLSSEITLTDLKDDKDNKKFKIGGEEIVIILD